MAANDDRSIVITRVIDAPRELVFEAFTHPNHLAHWWGPDGFSLTTHSFDMRPGGVWRFVMHGPDGRDYQNRITWDEIAPPERIAYHHGGGDDVEPVQFSTTVRFEEVGGKTRLTLHMLFPSAAERDRVEREYHAVEGGNQTVGRLAAYAADDGHRRDRGGGGDHPPPRRAARAGVAGLDRPGSSRALVGAARLHQPGLRDRCAAGRRHPHRHARPRRHGLSDDRGISGNNGAQPACLHGRAARSRRQGAGRGATPPSPSPRTAAKTRLTVKAHAKGLAPVARLMLAGMEAGWTQSIERLAELVAKM